MGVSFVVGFTERRTLLCMMHSVAVQSNGKSMMMGW